MSLKRCAGIVLATCLVVSSAPVYARDRLANPKVQIAFGNQVVKRGLWGEAAFRYAKAAKMDPKNKVAYNNLGVAFEALGKFEGALEAYKRALELAPNDNKIRQNYARFAEFYASYMRSQGKAVQNAQ